MQKRLKSILLIESIFLITVSFPLHFLYDLTGIKFIGYFVPISESVWEHLKLLFFPAIITSTLQYLIFGKEYMNFITAKIFGLFAGVFAIAASFYTYSGIVGKNFLIADIFTYIFGVLVYEWLSYVIIKNGKFASRKIFAASLMLFFTAAASFIIFTHHPPQLAIFCSF